MSERTVKHSTIVVERNFKGAPARVFAPWAELDVHRRWNVPGNDWKSQSMKIPFELGWGQRSATSRKRPMPLHAVVHDTIVFERRFSVAPDKV
jgi:uncharacterized protein YndB with AHSA1/START domain